MTDKLKPCRIHRMNGKSYVNKLLAKYIPKSPATPQRSDRQITGIVIDEATAWNERQGENDD